MKTKQAVGKTLFAVALIVCALAGSSAWAQTADNVAGQTPKAVPARITQAIDSSALFTSKGSVNRMARPEFDQGVVPDATPMKRMLLSLKRSPEQQAALKQLMGDQMTKDSPNFHKWLTPQEFGTRFGAADADIQAITGWLASQGFTGIRVAAGRTVIEFSGNVGQVRAAFHTGIHRFMVNGELHQANVSDPQVPMALSPVVRGVMQLHDFHAKSMRQTKGLYKHTPDGKIVSELTGTTNNFFAVGPADFAKIYNIPAGLDGLGGKIAIVGFSDINPADVDNFRSIFSLPPKNLNIVVNGEDPGFNGEEGEAALDVQSSGAVARRAQIDYILTEGTITSDPIILSAEYVINNNSDDVMSLSFGNCEAVLGASNVQTISDFWEQASAQGISVVVSAGDNGTAGCDDFNTQSFATGGLAVNGLASTAFNVAVGGTDFDDVGNQAAFWNQNPGANGPGLLSAKGYIHEIPWNDSCAAAATSANLTTCATPDNIVAGSGGESIFVPKPAFQTGIVPNGVSAANATFRFLPDISLFASDGANSLSFYVECTADTGADCVPDSTGAFSFQGVGGTSASAPSFAGVLALVGQSEFNAGRSRRLGNANLVLYNLAKTAANSCNSSTTPLTGSATCVFYDVTKGNNAVPCSGGAAANCSAATGGVLVTTVGATTSPAFTTSAGYDLATGLGSLNVANLATKWPTATFTATTTTTTINGATTNLTITHGTPVTLAAHVSSGAGVPTGDISFLTSTGGSLGSAQVDASGNVQSPAPGTVISGGMYTVKAHYSGDATFAPSDDATGVQVTVNKEASHVQPVIVQFDINTGQITIVGGTTFQFGSPYILRVDITNSAGTPATCNPLALGGDLTNCAFDATGTVILANNAAPLDQSPYHLNSEGHFEDNLIDLTGGPHTVVATYSGDNSYLTSNATLNLTVTKAPTTTTVSANPTAGVTVTTPVNLTATIASASISPTGSTGTVTFFDNGTAIGSAAAVTPVSATASTNAGGTAVLVTTFATAATHNITATYSGDGNYATSTTAAAVAINVGAGPNPLPTVSTIAPNSASAGDPAFTLTVNGTGFVSTSVVNFGGAPKATTLVSATQLTAAITAADIATAGAKPVTVISPAPGGGTSTPPVNFTVNAVQTPTITNVSPGSALIGSGAFTLTVNGTNFTATSVVNFGGAARVTTFVSATQLTAAILAGDITTAGTKAVTVTNIAPGGPSNSVNFTVTNPIPTITTLSPTSAAAGGATFTLTVNGSSFVSNSVVNFGATALTTAFVSGAQLTASVPAAAIATAGNVTVTVTNPAPVGGTSNGVTFAVNNPVPTVTTLNPTNVNAGAAGFNLTVNGTNFVATSVVNFAGAPKVTTFVSATQLTAAILATDVASAGAKPVTVTNPAPGGGTSTPAVNFTVNAANPTFTVVLGAAVPITATAGATTTVMVPVTIHPTGGGAPGNVNVICSALPPGVTCNNGAAFTINAGSADTIGQLPVALVGPSSTLTAMALPQSGDRLGLVAAGLGSGLAAMLVLLLPGRKRLRAGLGLSLCLVCVLTLALGCSGPGGGGGGPVATTTKITLTNAAKQAGGAASFAFTVQVTGGTSPTGTVQILDGATALGNPTVTSGAASFTFSGVIPVGTHVISAHYSGDSGHMASSSGAINVTVTGNATVTIAVQGATNSPQTQNITIN